MSEAKSKGVLWPDLARFGVRLTVAYNPSVGRNYLRFAVLDRDLTAMESGHPNDGTVDFFRRMREEGFTYVPSETEFRRRQVLREADDQGVPREQQEEVEESERKKLYFYSPSLAIRKEMLTRLIPAIQDSDFKEMPVTEIKHLDFRYLDGQKAAAAFEKFQAFESAEVGVFYTTPRDRALLADLARDNGCVLALLREQKAADQSEVRQFHLIPAIGRLLQGQAFGPDGVPLRPVSATALIVGFPRYEDAVAANGGDENGIAREAYEYALPIAFDYPSRRVIVAKDARFLEMVGARTADSHGLSKASNVQELWGVLDRVQAIRRQFEEMRDAGLLVEGVRDDADMLARALRGLDAIQESMAALTGGAVFGEYDIRLMGGLNRAEMARVFGSDFVEFLERFPSLKEEMSLRQADMTARKAAASGMNAAMSNLLTLDEERLSARREDAGEKIGGARKDYAKRWLEVSELSGMTVRERADVVTKDNIWPAPDYAAMEADGVDPLVAYVLRELRHALPVNPYRGGYNVKRYELQARAARDLTLEQCESFVNAVSLVRDALAGVRTKEDLLRGVYEIQLRKDENRHGRWGWNSNNWFDDGAGYHFCCRVLPEVSKNHDGAVSSCEMERLFRAAEAKTRGGWEWAGKKKRPLADAEALAASKRERPEPEVPHLEHIVREGVNYRQDKNVDEQVLLDVFGFRGVEYGNWLPQNERQTVINHAFDAFMDLASVMGLPPKAISLGGELSVAFGARGRGGKSAALAHYEPGRNVINLTRLSGAGSLAHEWGHALDYFLAKSCGISQSRSLMEVATKGVRVNRANGERLIADFVKIAEESRKRYRTKEEVLEDIIRVETAGAKQSISDFLRGHLAGWVAGLDRTLPEDKRGGVFLEFAKQEVEKSIETVDGYDGKVCHLVDTDALARNIGTALDLQAGKEWRGRGYNLDYPQQLNKWIESRIEKLELIEKHYKPNSYPGSSRFLNDAAHYDSFRSKPYWSTPVEMFARAFESWVQDRVEATPGHRSQYLVYGKQENLDAEYSGYPRGEERDRIGQTIAAFFEAHRPELLRRLALLREEPRVEEPERALSA